METRKCLKNLLLASNAVLVMAAVALVTVGVLIQTEFHVYLKFLGVQPTVAGILLFMSGVVVLLIVSSGCLGVVRDNANLVLVFAALLGFAVFLELVGGVLGFLKAAEMRETACGHMLSTQKDYGRVKDVTAAWDGVQQRFRCCGASNFTEWYDYLGEFVVPDSCCNRVTALCGAKVDLGEPIYRGDCIGSFSAWAQAHVLLMGAVSVGVALAQILMVGLACVFYRSLQRYKLIVSS